MADLEELSHVIVEFYEKLSSWEYSVVRDQGMTLPQMHTLEILGVNPPLRMKELAQKMGVTTGTLTVQVDRLVRSGMVRRCPHQEDRRSILVELTEEGREQFLQHHGLHEQLTRDITAGLTDEERDTLTDLLSRLTREF
ncbi:MAG: MarR family winged helix-turn-helix transcriptional regulator [Oceanidesulfovibrio sp.]